MMMSPVNTDDVVDLFPYMCAIDVRLYFALPLAAVCVNLCQEKSFFLNIVVVLCY